jgi:hypothetical protein
MSKIKIEIELDIDFQKFFDNIPAGLYSAEDNDTVDSDWELQAVSNVFRNIYVNALMNKMDWMVKKEYAHAEHHLLIEEEISKQLMNNYKIIEHTNN